MGAFDGFRNLFNVRAPRGWPPRGPVPRIGAKVCRHDLRLIVQAGLGHELWEWLQDRGFRENTHKSDRRRYRDLPTSLVIKLFDAPSREWTSLLRQAVAEAYKRPAVNAGDRSVRSDR